MENILKFSLENFLQPTSGLPKPTTTQSAAAEAWDVKKQIIIGKGFENSFRIL
jgi:hypothetical protein